MKNLQTIPTTRRAPGARLWQYLWSPTPGISTYHDWEASTSAGVVSTVSPKNRHILGNMYNLNDELQEKN